MADEVMSYEGSTGMIPYPPKIRVCHIAMGDLWAGAEVQLAILLASLVKIPEFEISAILFNEGRLASELHALGVEARLVEDGQPTSLLLWGDSCSELIATEASP